MSGFIRAVALDLDGTLTHGDGLSEAAMSAVDQIRDDGLSAVLVTGRILTELEQAFPGLADRFDAVVAENGAVLALNDEVRDLTEPVEEALTAALAERGSRCGADVFCSLGTPPTSKRSSPSSAPSAWTARSCATEKR